MGKQQREHSSSYFGVPAICSPRHVVSSRAKHERVDNGALPFGMVLLVTESQHDLIGIVIMGSCRTYTISSIMIVVVG